MSENKATQKTLSLQGRKIVLVGTAHVSKASIEEVEISVEKEKPDTVAIELDSDRLKNIEDSESWKKMDIIKVLKKKQGFLLLTNIVLSSYQKRIGEGTGVKPGDEMVAAIKKARELGIPQVMVDRPIGVTMRRAWAKNSFWGKLKLLAMIIATAFSKEEVSESEIENLKETSEMDTMMKDLSSQFPVIKEVLIDERDFYLASKIWACQGNTVLAVLGAGHLPGVSSHLELISQGKEKPDLSGIDTVPKKTLFGKLASWIIPILIIALIVTGFIIGGIEKGADLLQSWFLWNGILAAVGAFLAGGHILTLLVSAVCAPFTSLCPFIGVGFVSGIVQALVKKPTVQDMENLSSDASGIKGFYRNRILRVLLVFLLSSIGSSVGTFIGGASFISIFAR